MLRALAPIALAACCVAPAVADEPSKPISDGQFVEKAAIGGMFEVHSSKIAMEKTTNAEVKKIAEKMVTDHHKANEKLKALAASKTMPLPKGLDLKHKAMITELEALSGATLDKEYLKMQVKAHKATIAMFEEKSKDAADPDLKSFVEETLPVLKAHAKMIYDAADSMGVAAE